MDKVVKGSVSEDKLPSVKNSDNGRKRVLRSWGIMLRAHGVVRVEMSSQRISKKTTVARVSWMRRKMIGDALERREKSEKAKGEPCGNLNLFYIIWIVKRSQWLLFESGLFYSIWTAITEYHRMSVL